MDGLGASGDVPPGPFVRSDGGRVGRPGRWTACVLVRPDVVTDPTQIVAVPIQVSLLCTAATRRLATARARWRTAYRNEVLEVRAEPERLRRLGRAVAAAQRPVARWCDTAMRERMPA